MSQRKPLTTTALSPTMLSNLHYALQYLEKEFLPVHSLQPWTMPSRTLLEHLHRIQSVTATAHDGCTLKLGFHNECMKYAAEEAGKFITLLGEEGGEVWEDVVGKLGPIVESLKEMRDVDDENGGPQFDKDPSSIVASVGGEEDLEYEGRDTSDFPRFRDLPAELRLMIWKHALPDPQTIEVFEYQKLGKKIHAASLHSPQKHLLSLRSVNKEARRTLEENEYDTVPLYNLGVEYAGRNAVMLFDFKIDTLFYPQDVFRGPMLSGSDKNAANIKVVLAKVQNLALEEWSFNEYDRTRDDGLRRLLMFTALKNLTWVGDRYRGYRSTRTVAGSAFVLDERISVAQGKELRARMIDNEESYGKWYTLSTWKGMEFLNDFKVNMAYKKESGKEVLLSGELYDLVHKEEKEKDMRDKMAEIHASIALNKMKRLADLEASAL